jgi:hypothetical protein
LFVNGEDFDDAPETITQQRYAIDHGLERLARNDQPELLDARWLHAI